MTRASFETNPLTSSRPGRRPSNLSSGRRPGTTLLAGFAVGVLLLGACGGDDDDSESSATSVAVTVAPTTAPRATATVAPATTTTTIAYDTEGATVVVANASGINGAAGRMSDGLAVVGFTVGDPTNSSEAVGQLETTKVYYDPDVERAMAVAASVREALGGGDIELLEVGVPAPVESGELGDASVLLMMGNDTADKTLAELQGLVAPATTEAPDAGGDDEAPDTTEPADDEAPETTEPADDEAPEDTTVDNTEG